MTGLCLGHQRPWGLFRRGLCFHLDVNQIVAWSRLDADDYRMTDGCHLGGGGFHMGDGYHLGGVYFRMEGDCRLDEVCHPGGDGSRMEGGCHLGGGDSRMEGGYRLDGGDSHMEDGYHLDEVALVAFRQGMACHLALACHLFVDADHPGGDELPVGYQPFAGADWLPGRLVP